MNKLGKALGAVAVAGAVAAGGSAFTTSNTPPTNNIAGYSNTTVTGVTVSEVDYTLSTNGSQVTGLVITTAGDTEHITVRVSFGSGALEACGAGTEAGGETTYTRDVNDINTADADDLDIAATETA